MEPEELPAKPFHPVPDWRAAHFSAYGQTQPPVGAGVGPVKHEKDETLGVVAPSPLIAIEELAALHQVKGLGEA